MTKEKKIERLREIKGLLETFDKTDQKNIIWHLLQVSLSGDREGVTWLLDEMDKFLDGETKILFSPFQ